MTAIARGCYPCPLMFGVIELEVAQFEHHPHHVPNFILLLLTEPDLAHRYLDFFEIGCVIYVRGSVATTLPQV